MTSQKIYEKKKQKVGVYNKFIYCSSVYKIWDWGASLIEEKYYSSDKPITLKKKDIKIKKKNYIIFRFLTLEFATENYLINNGFKLIENERHC